MCKMIFRTELVLLLRNKFLAIPIIINVLFWGYIVISYEIGDVHIQERATAFYSGFLWIMLFNLLIMGMFAVYMTSKDRESEFEDLVVTYRVKNTEWVTGKWLATQVYGLCITLVTLLIQTGWFLSGKMTIGEVVQNVFYVFMQMEGALFFVITLGFLCGVLMKNVFAYILVPAILTLSLLLPIDYTDTGDALWFDNPRLHLLTPFDLMYVGSPYEGIWGLNRMFGRTILHQSAVFLFGIVVLLLALVFFHQNRRIQKEKKIVPVLLVVVMIPTLLLGGIRYMQYDQALTQYITTGKQYAQGYEGPDHLDEFYEQLWMSTYYDTSLEHKKYDFSIENTNLAVTLQKDHQLDVTSKLTIKHNGHEPVKEVHLTLHHGLTLTECTSESKITCTRDKDLITLEFEEMVEPDEQFDLYLDYQGNILQYREDGNIEHSFIGENRVYLPKEAGWYPLIGDRQLVIAWENDQHYAGFEQRNGSFIEDYATEFSVEILNEVGEIPLALTIPEIEAGMYQGASQYGLSLIGGNFKEMRVGETRVVGHPEVLKGVTEKVEKYQKSWRFIEEWLEKPMTPSVIYILNAKYTYLTSNTPNQEFLVWDNSEINYTDGSDEIASDLWTYLTREYTSESIWEKRDYHYLRSAMEWVIYNHFYEGKGMGFKEWYIDRWYEINNDEADLFNLIQSYAEKSNEDFEDTVKHLLEYVEQLGDKDDFNLKEALQLYEGDKSL